jgi:hypothetical protein
MINKIANMFKKQDKQGKKVGVTEEEQKKNLDLLINYQEQIVYALEQALVLLNIEKKKFEVMLASYLLSQGKDTAVLEQDFIDSVYDNELGVDVVNNDKGQTELMLYRINEQKTEETSEDNIE